MILCISLCIVEFKKDVYESMYGSINKIICVIKVKILCMYLWIVELKKDILCGSVYGLKFLYVNLCMFEFEKDCVRSRFCNLMVEFLKIYMCESMYGKVLEIFSV